ncbi:unnamed protein product [Diamesa serratosioi]
MDNLNPQVCIKYVSTNLTKAEIIIENKLKQFFTDKGIDCPKEIITFVRETFKENKINNDDTGATKLKTGINNILKNYEKKTNAVKQIKNIITNELHATFYKLRTIYYEQRERSKFSEEDAINHEKVSKILSGIEKQLKLKNNTRKDFEKMLNKVREVKDIVFIKIMNVWLDLQAVSVKKGERCDSFLPSMMQGYIKKMFDFLEEIEIENEMVKPVNDVNQESLRSKIQIYSKDIFKKCFIYEVELPQICRTTPKHNLIVRIISGDCKHFRERTFNDPELLILTADEAEKQFNGLPFTPDNKFKIRIDKGSMDILSMPVVITSHTTQHPDAYANITWLNSKDTRTTFGKGEEKLKWSELVKSIKLTHIALIGENTFPLTEKQLTFLKVKALRLDEYANNEQDAKISKIYFNRENLEEYPFTFWNWFEKTTSFVQLQCKDIWNHGYILGYISKQSAEELLKRYGPGTFILRFSESQLGALSIIWMDEDRQIYNQIPTSSEDIPKSTSLANIIENFEKLKYLCFAGGIIDKNQVFITVNPKKPKLPEHYDNKLEEITNMMKTNAITEAFTMTIENAPSVLTQEVILELQPKVSLETQSEMNSEISFNVTSNFVMQTVQDQAKLYGIDNQCFEEDEDMEALLPIQTLEPNQQMHYDNSYINNNNSLYTQLTNEVRSPFSHFQQQFYSDNIVPPIDADIIMPHSQCFDSQDSWSQDSLDEILNTMKLNSSPIDSGFTSDSSNENAYEQSIKAIILELTQPVAFPNPVNYSSRTELYAHSYSDSSSDSSDDSAFRFEQSRNSTAPDLTQPIAISNYSLRTTELYSTQNNSDSSSYSSDDNSCYSSPRYEQFTNANIPEFTHPGTVPNPVIYRNEQLTNAIAPDLIQEFSYFYQESTPSQDLNPYYPVLMFDCSFDENLLNTHKSAVKFKKDFKDLLTNPTTEFPNSLIKTEEDKRIFNKSLKVQTDFVHKEHAKVLFSELRKSFLLRLELSNRMEDIDRFSYKKINDKMFEIDLQLFNLKLSHNVYNDLRNLLNLFEVTKIEVELWLNSWIDNKKNAIKDGKSYQSFRLCIIQVWFERLFDFLNKIEPIAEDHSFNFYQKMDCNHTIRKFYTELINCSFVIETEPSQVVRAAPKILLKLRCLAGNAEFFRKNNLKVEIKIVDIKSKVDTRFELKSNESLIVYDQFTNNLIYDGIVVINVVSRKLQKKTKVTDEMFHFSFKTTFTVKDQKFSIDVLSVPFVIIVHTSQNADAYATVVWHNAMSEIIKNEDKTWNKIVGQLQSKLRAFVSNDIYQLTENQLNCLKYKACGSSFERNPIVTKKRFCSDKLLDSTFTFYQWYYATFNFIELHCLGAFNDGYIMGYVKKSDAETILRRAGSIPGMFLLRFSDTILNAISIVWVDDTKEVQNHRPLTIIDLPQNNPLANIICNNSSLTHLYTEKEIFEKNFAFRKYTYVPSTVSKGYSSKLTKSEAPSEIPSEISSEIPFNNSENIVKGEHNLAFEEDAKNEIMVEEFEQELVNNRFEDNFSEKKSVYFMDKYYDNDFGALDPTAPLIAQSLPSFEKIFVNDDTNSSSSSLLDESYNDNDFGALDPTATLMAQSLPSFEKTFLNDTTNSSSSSLLDESYNNNTFDQDVQMKCVSGYEITNIHYPETSDDEEMDTTPTVISKSLIDYNETMEILIEIINNS